ncbi:MAG: zinc-ribbon domain-containing protein [Clostridia bacterium]|nr:zinc-ribbon domain-containing protein [Clostridia bacterium]
MFCPNCGAPQIDGDKFCPNCGFRFPEPEPAEPAPAQPVPEVVSTEPVPAEKKPKKKKKLGLIIGLCAAAVAVAAALVFVLLVLPEQRRVKRYNEGVTLLEQKAYGDAEEVFLELGSYADSEDLLAYAQRGVAYENAKRAMEKGNYGEAIQTFEADPDFEEAAKLRNRCRAALNVEEAKTLFGEERYDEALAILNELYKVDTEGRFSEEAEQLSKACDGMIRFNEAKALYEQGEYEQALELIDRYELYGIEGADAIAADCKREIGYQKIIRLMDEGAYREALDLLNSEAGNGMEDRAARRTECENRITYAEAEEALKNGRNYDAYRIFRTLGSFADSGTRAKNCIVNKPKTSETYHNNAYNSSSVSLTIIPPKDDTCTYFKIYAVKDGKETLISCAFIRSGEKVTVKMPEGTYLFKSAYSSGDWFGETDMFGDNGIYQRLKVNGADTCRLTKGKWELKLRQNVSDGNVETASENRNNF